MVYKLYTRSLKVETRMWYVVFSWIMVFLSIILLFVYKDWKDKLIIFTVGASFAIGLLFVN